MANSYILLETIRTCKTKEYGKYFRCNRCEKSFAVGDKINSHQQILTQKLRQWTFHEIYITFSRKSISLRRVHMEIDF